MNRLCRSRRNGITLTEVLVVIAILSFLTLMLMLLGPRNREPARSVQCDNNLMQLGLGMGYYTQATDHLPSIPLLPTTLAEDTTSSPIGALLASLSISGFSDLEREKSPYVAGRTTARTLGPIRGLICPSDSYAFDDPEGSPQLSYRAVTGDTPEGHGGAFEPGKIVTLAAVEAGDGLSYTACFTERLVGFSLGAQPYAGNYHLTDGPLIGPKCPEPGTEPESVDAGKNWSLVDWTNTLINHAAPPNASRSCITKDGKSALMSSSSGHLGVVHHLMLDGSARRTNVTIDLKLWKALASFQDGP